MSQPRGGGRGGRGRGAPLHAVRGQSQPNSQPAAASSVTSSAPAASATAPFQPPLHRPLIAFQIIQQIQEFLVQLAWQEVRSGAVASVQDQKTRLLESFQRFIGLFLDNSIQAANDSYPTCPESLRTCDRTAAVALLNQSTNSGRASLTKDALYRKAKKGTQKLLKYMADWVRIAKDPTTRPGEFTPSTPPSGNDRNWMWNKIKSTEHRAAVALKIWKSRSTNRHLSENTDASISEALQHLIFARRGYSLDEEMALRGRSETEAFLNADEENVYNAVQEEVRSGTALVDSDDDEAHATANTQGARATATAPRGYFEQPYCEASGIYHPFELAFKAFTQYAGSGHADISAFYTSEWADLQRTQASSGGTGRTHQRNQLQSDREGDASRDPAVTRESQQPSPATAFSSQSTQQMHNIAAQMEASNSLGQHTRMTTTYEKAIQLAIDLEQPAAVVQQIRRQYFDTLMAQIQSMRMAPQAPVGAPAAPSAVQSTLVPAASLFPATPSRTHSSGASSPPTTQRRRPPPTPYHRALELISAGGEIVENTGEGNCLFHCFATIEEDYVDVCSRRRPREDISHGNLRRQVVETLRYDSGIVRIAEVADRGTQQTHSIFADEDMMAQKQTVDAYCDWMANDGSSGSQIEIAAFVHERPRLRIVVHRTLMEGDGRYQQQLYESAATASSRQDRIVHHIVHYVSDDLLGGHYAYFLPNVAQVD
jgi:hypothetical protein